MFSDAIAKSNRTRKNTIECLKLFETRKKTKTARKKGIIHYPVILYPLSTIHYLIIHYSKSIIRFFCSAIILSLHFIRLIPFFTKSICECIGP